MGNKIVEALSYLTTADEAAPDILVLNFTIVTACAVGNADRWVLVDTGLENSAGFILNLTEERFGKDNRPQSILLTHGHFDHVGSVIKLSQYWDVPVYAHELELPYITGKKDYPLADTAVDEGIVAKLSETYPHTGIDLGYRAVMLPSDGRVPGLPEWKWIHTPGHCEGHVSLFRERDRVLIAGDAFSTTKQESLLSVMTQREQISGPPKYFTTDWGTAKRSIKRLKNLNPDLAIPSHGKPMRGDELREHLDILIRDFNDIAKPKQGRYVNT